MELRTAPPCPCFREDQILGYLLIAFLSIVPQSTRCDPYVDNSKHRKTSASSRLPSSISIRRIMYYLQASTGTWPEQASYAYPNMLWQTFNINNAMATARYRRPLLSVVDLMGFNAPHPL
ncbi:hypothetical protein PILCRDRAFT_123727 [Piloderma croceum F 1598]|uniref:Uncharacterized protein n=1 Tax=Piloderma croceum (strain F 1598) TaxID=765440 RepID=A0A0C3GPI7_PILCF|nr:hypothetical protein PILCRDRAFT_123727 [Piloderma croceum F 1598]